MSGGPEATLRIEDAFLSGADKDNDPDGGSRKRHALESLVGIMGDRLAPGGGHVFRIPADNLFGLLAIYERDAP